MHRGSSGNESQSGVNHKLGSQATQPQQQPIQQSADLPQGLPHTSGYGAPQHPMQQYIINPVAGAQGSHIITTSRPVPTSPIRVPAQHAQGLPAAVILQQQQQQLHRHQQQQQLSQQDVARQQALMQLAGLQSQLVARTSSQVVSLQLSPGYGDPTIGIPVHQMSINTPQTSVSAANNPYVFNDTPKIFPQGEELQISPEQIHLQSLLLPSHHQPVGTIHHHGQGSPRSTMPPLGFGVARRLSSHSPTRGTPDHRKSPTAAAGGSTYNRSLSSPARANPVPSSPSRMRKSPVMASETDRPPATNEVAELRTRLLEHKLKDLHDLQDGYKDKLAELFFLENGYNMMDFLAWKKRPSATLNNFMTSRKLEGQEEEITINDEVKVITNSGSNIPLGTPVAISTQLPPAVSALSSQIKAKELRKSFPGALPTASPDLDRKRTYSQAGLDGSSTSERKPLGFPSTHEPNVTLSPKTITPIPALPGSQPSLLYKQQQQQQHKQLAAGQQQQQQQQQGTLNRVPSTVSSATAPGLSHVRTSLSVPHPRREPKSPPAAKHSLHQLKLPTSRPLTVNTTTGADVTTAAATVVGSTSPRRHLSGGSTTGAPPLPQKLPKSPISPNAHQRLATRQHSLSAVYDYTIGSQEMIVERAKQEAQVMQRIAELRKEGLWSVRRLPKVQEPPRHKTHWEYLLEEAQWLATDFVQERRWKKAAARKLVRAVARHHQEKHAKEVKAEREETQKLRRIAANMAKEIKTFWSNIEKVVQYKQQSRLEERRRKAMDMQLDYIVGQTEKYSSWLTEGLNLNAAGSSAQGSVASSPRSDPGLLATGEDVDFQPDGDDTDDEETIDVEEREAEHDQDAHQKELELLQKDSEVPLEDLIGSLPSEILEGKGEQGVEAGAAETGEEVKVDVTVGEEDRKDEEEAGLSEVTKEAEESPDKVAKADEEFVPSTDDEDEEMPDDEETLEEQEAAEGTMDHTAEVAELEAEGEMTMEELLKKYSGAYDEDFEMPVSEEEEEDDEEEEEEETEEEEDEDSATDEEAELTDVGMEYLINPDKENEAPTASTAKASGGQSQDGGPNKEITDIAAAAQSLQPTGYTLSTTQVKTPVPFLLRHKLREYQHIGLDWLVTMNDKRLNGILADEMGLGKTIQTIALLAHLACETGNWGPHLIVVPTSVMLNWEMEFKKWCPGFKILTYFGNQKERKLKRQGWTKSNAFHVCITSYKLVIQDHQSFRRKKWKYLVLDEAQNIKNFKSQRWQTLLNFNSQRRLLLTGTPLQNNLMELWSLMHFLMPHVFASHREFREWFSNPLSGMIEGTQEYNEGLIRRLHKVLRPFLLRRLKIEVERQLPQKYEHLVRCRLSRRQRFLYDDFMSQSKTRETLSSGHFMSVINVLMQLRKVCNHPDLFELRPIQSPFQMEGIQYYAASLITKVLEHDPFKHVSLNSLNLCVASLELFLPAYAAHRIKQLQTPRPLIEEIDSAPEPPPRPQPMKIKPGKLFPPPMSQAPKEPKPAVASATSSVSATVPGRASPVVVASQGLAAATGGRASPSVSHVLVRSSTGVQLLRQTGSTQQGLVLDGRSSPSVSLALTTTTTSSTGVPSLTLVSHPSVPSSTPLQQLPGYTGVVISSAGSPAGQQRFYLQQQTSGAGRGQFITTQPITVQLQGASGGPGTTIRLPAGQIRQMSQSGIVQIVQTPSGHQVLRPAVRLSSPSTSQQQQQQQNQSRASPVPIQMTLQATSPQIPRSILQQGAVSGNQTTTLAQSQAQTVIQALAQAVTQASPSSSTGVVMSSQSQQLQSVLAQFQRQQLEQRQLQQQKLQVAASQAATTTSASVTSSQAFTTTSKTVSKPIASVAPMVNVTVNLTNAVKTVVTSALSSLPKRPETPTKLKDSSETPGTKKLEVKEGIAKTTTAMPTAAVTSPPPLIAIRPHHAPNQVPPTPRGIGGSIPSSVGETKPTPAPLMQPVLKIRPLSSVSIAKATGSPKVSVTTSGSRPAVTATPQRSHKSKHNKDSPFFLESMHKAEVDERKATLARIADLNQHRCAAKPVYGSDLRSVVSILNSPNPAGKDRPYASCTGMFHCREVHGLPFPHGYEARLSQTDTLRKVIRTPEDILVELKEIIKRFVMVVPLATSPPISMHTYHPAPSAANQHRLLRETLRRELTPTTACLHPIQTGMKFQFPELRLIQYDCGKLQALDVLLRKLKAGDHRVLIFTQMTRMLDVLEAFLNYHGHIYVRLDGTTKVEQRQFLMDRFNMDKRIFCFILSTRSGGLGINLTGADTVVFYDSDWNPTMDAQAQDRCHRIGQTRDVHIYRLISEMTVEENILKKANQKRLLVDVSIEGGNFTTAFFKTNTIKDLFDMSNRRNAQPVAIEDLVINSRPEQTPSKTQQAAEEKEAITQNQLEQALAKTEDETDVKATSKALAEQDAELAEFDETIPYEGEETKAKEEVSKIEIELAQLDDQLTNIEKYAMRYLESNMEPAPMDDVLEAEEQIQLAKKEWELERLQALKEEEERKAEQEEDEIFFTYCDEEAKNKVHKSRSKSRQTQGGSSRAGSQKSSRASSRSGSAERPKRNPPASTGRSTRRNPKPDPAADDSGPRSPVTRSGATKSPPPPTTAVLSPRSPLARLAPTKPSAKKTGSAKSPPEKTDTAKSKQKSKGQKSSMPKEPESKQSSESAVRQLGEETSRSCSSPMDLSVGGPNATVSATTPMDLSMSPRKDNKQQEVMVKHTPTSVTSEPSSNPTVTTSPPNSFNVQPLNLSPRSKQPQHPTNSDLPPMPGLVSSLTGSGSPPPPNPNLPSIPLLLPRHPLSSHYSSTPTVLTETPSIRASNPNSHPSSTSSSLESILQRNLNVVVSSATGVQSLTAAQLLSLGMSRPNLSPLQLVQPDTPGIPPRFGLPTQSQMLRNPPPLQPMPHQQHLRPQAQHATLLQQQYRLQVQQQQSQVAAASSHQMSSSPQPQPQSQSQMPVLARLQMLTQPRMASPSQTPTLRLSLSRPQLQMAQRQLLAHQQILGAARLRSSSIMQSQPRQQGQPILARLEVLPVRQPQLQSRGSSELLTGLQLADSRTAVARQKVPLQRMPHPVRIQAPVINPQILLQLQSQSQTKLQSQTQPQSRPQTIAQALAQTLAPQNFPAPTHLPSTSQGPSQTPVSISVVPVSHQHTAQPQHQPQTAVQTTQDAPVNMPTPSQHQSTTNGVKQLLTLTVPDATVPRGAPVEKLAPTLTKASPQAAQGSLISTQSDRETLTNAPAQQSPSTVSKVATDSQRTSVSETLPNLSDIQISTHAEAASSALSPPQLTPQPRVDASQSGESQIQSLSQSWTESESVSQMSPPSLAVSGQIASVARADSCPQSSNQTLPIHQESCTLMKQVDAATSLDSEQILTAALSQLKQKEEGASDNTPKESAIPQISFPDLSTSPSQLSTPANQSKPTPLSFPQRISPHPTHSPPSTQSSPNSQSPPLPKSPALSCSPEPLDLSPQHHKVSPLKEAVRRSSQHDSTSRSGTARNTERCIFDLSLSSSSARPDAVHSSSSQPEQKDGRISLPKQDTNQVEAHLTSRMHLNAESVQNSTTAKSPEPDGREESHEQRNIFQVLSSLMRSPPPASPALPLSPSEVVSPSSASPVPVPFDLTIPKSPQPSKTIAAQQHKNYQSELDNVAAANSDGLSQSSTSVRNFAQGASNDTSSPNAATEAPSSPELAKAALAKKLAKIQLSSVDDGRESTGPRTRAMSGAELADKLIQTRSRSRHHSASPALTHRDLKGLSRASSRSSSATNSRDVSPARGGTPTATDKNVVVKRGRGRPRKYPERS
ncbi:helicase SRCAP-like isoform X2 [Patiria miniata]|uniref:Helicase domino n=1 Tax=Patiria miniata TaxID=46514 RepID=A0A914BFW5_PATMI|nr:helicase SRCAP-like isoform X2 [Patiria miniata]